MLPPTPAALYRSVDARVTLHAVAAGRVSVQLRLPKLVAAVELPSTNAGRVRLPGAVMLSAPAWVVPVTVWVPLPAAAEAELEPITIIAPAMANPAVRPSGRRT